MMRKPMNLNSSRERKNPITSSMNSLHQSMAKINHHKEAKNNILFRSARFPEKPLLSKGYSSPNGYTPAIQDFNSNFHYQRNFAPSEKAFRKMIPPRPYNNWRQQSSPYRSSMFSQQRMPIQDRSNLRKYYEPMDTRSRQLHIPSQFEGSDSQFSETEKIIWVFNHKVESPWIPEEIRHLTTDHENFDFEKIDQCDSVCAPCKEFMIHKSIPLPDELNPFKKRFFRNFNLDSQIETEKLLDCLDVTESKKLTRNPLISPPEEFSDVETESFDRNRYNIFLTKCKNNLKLKHLKGLFSVLVKLLSNHEIVKIDLEISSIEMDLLMIFIKKKKFQDSKDVNELSLEFLNKIREIKCFKRTEEYFKYIFKKCFRFMANRFRNSKFRKVEKKLKMKFRSSRFKFDYAFYGYYFGEVAEKLNLPIEKFFHFRGNDKSTAINTKTVSKLYLDYLKMNRKFLEGFKTYILGQMLNETYYLIISKTKNLLKNWENSIQEMGSLRAVQNIKENLQSNVKSKLPWSIMDVEYACKMTLEYIERN